MTANVTVTFSANVKRISYVMLTLIAFTVLTFLYRYVVFCITCLTLPLRRYVSTVVHCISLQNAQILCEKVNKVNEVIKYLK